MHRVDVPSATPDNLFTEGSPAGGVPATIVPADWLNDLQENVCEAIEQAGITLVKGNSDQLAEAIIALAATAFVPALGAGGVASSDYVKIPFKDKTTGVRRELILNFGVVIVNAGATSGSAPLPLAFPNANLRMFLFRETTAAPVAADVASGHVASNAVNIQTVSTSAASRQWSFLSMGY